MSQKELLYMEDAYNHEKLLLDIISCAKENIDDEKYVKLLEEQEKNHKDIMKDIVKFVGGCCE